jgi:hypothetical protein
MRGADAGVFARTVRNFEQSLAADTALNEKLRQTIRQWLSRPRRPVDLAVLTNRIYDELFLTPRADPWLGLVAADTFSAIEGDGHAVVTAGALTRFAPSAVVAGSRALTKSGVEMPVLKSVFDWKPDAAASLTRKPQTK